MNPILFFTCKDQQSAEAKRIILERSGYKVKITEKAKDKVWLVYASVRDFITKKR